MPAWRPAARFLRVGQGPRVTRHGQPAACCPAWSVTIGMLSNDTKARRLRNTERPIRDSF